MKQQRKNKFFTFIFSFMPGQQKCIWDLRNSESV